MVLGIDASNLRGGGGTVTHIREILSEGNPPSHGFERVVIWAGRDTLREMPQRPWLHLCQL